MIGRGMGENCCLSWGRTKKLPHKHFYLDWMPRNDGAFTHHPGCSLPYGMGRSYGDSCLLGSGTLIHTRRLNRFQSFDIKTGLIRVEAGITFDEILKMTVPRGWFIPVSPGTKYVTVGGAIANDIHGKNHHLKGTFGSHVKKFGLLRSDQKEMTCSPTENKNYFEATIGGLGLTGLILWVEFQLTPIPSSYLKVENIQFQGLSEFDELSQASDGSYEYTVAWVDSTKNITDSGNGHTFRGIFMRGSFTGEDQVRSAYKVHKKSFLSVPYNAPSFLLNPLSIRAFNSLYFHKQRRKKWTGITHYHPYFYPLDAVDGWNRLYGSPGFFQFQCVLPMKNKDALKEIISTITKSGLGSFLTVLKKFGGYSSPGWLSFPMEGYTLTLDFSNKGPSTQRLFKQLHKIVFEGEGRLYPAKDSLMPAHMFQHFYPRWVELEKIKDPKINSEFWKRVTSKSP